jgi:hypothetical protein
MRKIELEIDKLVGYAVVESDQQRIKKLGSAKLGDKGGRMLTVIPEELITSADRVNGAA